MNLPAATLVGIFSHLGRSILSCTAFHHDMQIIELVQLFAVAMLHHGLWQQMVGQAQA